MCGYKRVRLRDVVSEGECEQLVCRCSDLWRVLGFPEYAGKSWKQNGCARKAKAMAMRFVRKLRSRGGLLRMNIFRCRSPCGIRSAAVRWKQRDSLHAEAGCRRKSGRILSGLLQRWEPCIQLSSGGEGCGRRPRCRHA